MTLDVGTWEGGGTAALPEDYITQTVAILAKRGAGKSNAAVVIAERMFDAGLPWCAVDPKGDWHGVRSNAEGTGPGLGVVVLGGEHGQIPLGDHAGELVADLVAAKRLTCVLDVSDFSKAGQRRFLTAFARRLYKVNRDPLHLFLEECDDYIPQVVRGDDAAMVGAFEQLVKRGRFRGLGCTLISQRTASVNKDVLSQVETMIALRTTSPHDRRAIGDWVDYQAEAKSAVSQLPRLAPGEARVFSPSWLDVDGGLLQFARRCTFDAGQTPKHGETRREPTRLADVDLAEVQAAMASVEEKVAADDPKALRARIANLEAEIEMAERLSVEAIPNDVTELVQLAQGHFVDLHEHVGALGALIHKLAARVSVLPTTEQGPSPRVAPVEPGSSAPGRSASAAGSAATGSTPASTPHQQGPTAKNSPRSSETRPATGELHPTALRMLTVLASRDPLALTTAAWGAVADLTPSGGTWSKHLASLRGLVVERRAGWVLTDAGWDVVGERPAKLTGVEMRVHIIERLPGRAGEILAMLIDADDWLAKDDIAQRLGMAVGGGTFSSYLGALTRNDLAIRQDGFFRASHWLMEN